MAACCEAPWADHSLLLLQGQQDRDKLELRACIMVNHRSDFHPLCHVLLDRSTPWVSPPLQGRGWHRGLNRWDWGKWHY